MVRDGNGTRPGWERPEQGSGGKNIGKLVFLVVALVAAWFVPERLIGGKQSRGIPGERPCPRG